MLDSLGGVAGRFGEAGEEKLVRMVTSLEGEVGLKF
jgi:hypothetical protein